MTQILFLDAETGGLDPSTASLLSIGLAVWEQGEIKATTEIFLKHDAITVSPESLKVNRLNLLEHIERAVYPTEAASAMISFCQEHLHCPPPWVIGGHNIYFDLGFLRPFLKNQGYEWHKLFSHRAVDTSSILRFLFLSGILEEEIVSSDDAFPYFNIHVNGRHTALGDAIATAELFNHLLVLVKSKTQ